MAWNPFGVMFELTATGGTVTRTSATQYTVKITAHWETYYDGAQTNYGMTASSGGGSVTLNSFGTYASSGTGSFTGTYSISGNGSATKSITVTFRNFNNDNGDSATTTVSFNVTVPAWTSYTVSYNANGGSGAPSSQTKWKDQALTLSTTKPTQTGYTFSKWNTKSDGSGTSYSSGGSYTANSSATLYAQWKANTYTIAYNANGGSGSMSSQTVEWKETFTLRNNAFAKEGYKFVGWNAYRNNDKTWYVIGQGWLTDDEILAGGYSKKIYENQEELIFDTSWIKGRESSISSYTLYAIWEISGVVYIDNGTSLEPYLVYIDNGLSWDLYIGYIDDGTNWTTIS